MNTIPYTPVAFVFCGLIANSDQPSALTVQYNWEPLDFVIPKPLSASSSLYYLFHIDGIYNWLRDSPSSTELYSILSQYVSLRPACIAPVPLKYSNNEILQSLTQFSTTLEPVRLALKAKVYVQKLFDSCPHSVSLQKKQIWTQFYSYSPTIHSLESTMIECPTCRCKLSGQMSVIQQPYAPILNKPYGHIVTVLNQIYELVLVFSQSIFILSNGVCYEVKDSSVKPVSKDNMLSQKNSLFVYRKKGKETAHKLLRRAKQLANPTPQTTETKTTQTLKRLAERIQAQRTDNQQQKIQSTKLEKKYDKQTKPTLIPKLKSLKAHTAGIILPENSRVSQPYRAAIQPLLPKPKVKDQYELSYDKGKVKKIKKKREYIVPNFTKVYEQLKEGGDDLNSHFGGKLKKRRHHYKQSGTE